MKCKDAPFLIVFTDKQTNNPNHNIRLGATGGEASPERGIIATICIM